MRRQQQVMLQGLLKLTKDVKKLSVKEFDDAFGCDVIDMIKKVMVDGGVNSSGKKRVRHVGGGAAATTTGVAAVGGLNLKTPAHRFGKGVPATRTARRGEKIVS